jgi:hypothetical protein
MNISMLKVVAIVLLIVFLTLDCLFVTYRCSAGPEINWSHLGFGFLLQLIVVAALLAVDWYYDEADDKAKGAVALGALVFGLMSLLIARDSILFGDSVDAERTRTSKGFECPGVENVTFGHR